MTVVVLLGGDRRFSGSGKLLIVRFDSDVYILSVTFYTAHLDKDELLGVALWLTVSSNGFMLFFGNDKEPHRSNNIAKTQFVKLIQMK